MKRNRLVLTLASLTTGVGIGILVSFLFFPMNQTEIQGPPSVGFQPLASASSDDIKSIAYEERVLEDIIEIATATERRRALYRLLANKSGEQITELLRKTLTINNAKNSYSVQRILFAELARIRPMQSLELVWETERFRWGSLLDVVAIQWGSLAPEEALRAFSLLEEPWKGRAVETVFQIQTTLSESELTELSTSLNITETLDSWTFERQLAAVKDEPLVAFKFAVAADISDSRRHRVLTEITHRWMERDDADSISSMLNLVYEEFANSWNIWNPIVAEIAATNPQFVWEQLSSQATEVQELFNGPIFKAWVEQDPTTALQAITSTEFIGSMKSELNNLLWEWGRTVPLDQIQKNILLVPEDHRISFVNSTARYLAQNLPPNDVIEFLEHARLHGISTLVATDVFVSNWSRVDPTAAVQWAVQNLDQGSGDGTWMLERALDSLALLAPAKAMEIALDQPAERSLEQQVVLSVFRTGDIEQGLALLPQIRKVGDYSSFYSSVANTLVRYGRLDSAITVGQKLEASERSSYFRSVGDALMWYDIESVLEYLPNLEDTEVQEMIAAGVLMHHEWDSSSLTEEELEVVRALGPDRAN